MNSKTDSTKKKIAIFWFRRDLRLDDNAGLAHALTGPVPVLPLFIFDTRILKALKEKRDRRVEFIRNYLEIMNQTLQKSGSSLRVETGDPVAIFTKLLGEFDVKALYFNSDYEPYAKERDAEVGRLLRAAGAEVQSFKDQVIFEKLEVEKGTGGPYSKFTPYAKKWMESLKPAMLKAHECEKYFGHFLKTTIRNPTRAVPTLKEIGFRPTNTSFPSLELDRKILKRYAEHRNLPARNGTSRLGVHLRFGTVSLRELVKAAQKSSDVWLSELIWRDFFMEILWNYPQVVDEPFRSEYAEIPWREDHVEFQRWCDGKTGYPIVDAGMRELNETGFMHNRVRMVAASFLVKHLLISWKWGETYFAEKLLDFDLSSNNGNWQWVAGCGCDSAPYFRVFNPSEQERKFDPDRIYIKKWVPEIDTDRYPEPIVDHKFARDRAIRTYKDALHKARGYL